MYFRQVSDPHLAQNAYLIGCQATGEAVIVDPQRDVDRYVDLAARDGLRIVAVAETHIHADFLSGARELAERHDVTLLLSAEGGDDWGYRWIEGAPYDARLLRDGDLFHVGRIELEAMHTPGHTPEHLSFLVTDRGGGADRPMGILSGDFVFVGDVGRPDLLETAAGKLGAMEPAARTLHGSLVRFLDLPDHLQVWPGHGAGSACGKSLGAVPQSTVGYERSFNPSLQRVADGEDAFVEFILDGQPEPPPYFARMKLLNRDGVPLLGGLSRPEHLAPDEVVDRVAQLGGVIVDTRRDRRGYFGAHLPDSIYAPFNRTFPTIVGSYVGAEPIVLVAEPGDLDDIVRDLVRIGFDSIAGFIDLGALSDEERHTLPIQGSDVATMADVESLRERDDHLVLDVRGKGEYDAGHLPGALNIPHTLLLGRLDEVPADRTILVHCASGQRAASAAAALERAGRRVVFIDDWFDGRIGPEAARS